jgi:peroxiredoxin
MGRLFEEVRVLGYNFGVGRQAPDFTLTSHDGDRIPLSQYRGEWSVILVFYADDLAGAADSVKALSNAGTSLWGQRAQVVAVVHASAEGARGLADAAGAPAFPILIDEDGAVARAYGACDAAGSTRNYVAIVDRSGKVVWIGDGRAAPVKLNEIVAGLREVAR